MQARVLETGAILEAAGYAIEPEPERQPFVCRVQQVVGELPAKLREAFTDLPEPLSDIYNATKHAVRDRPDSQAMHDAVELSVLMLRCWVGVRLGVDEQVLLRGLSGPHRDAFERLLDRRV